MLRLLIRIYHGHNAFRAHLIWGLESHQSLHHSRKSLQFHQCSFSAFFSANLPARHSLLAQEPACLDDAGASFEVFLPLPRQRVLLAPIAVPWLTGTTLLASTAFFVAQILLSCGYCFRALWYFGLNSTRAIHESRISKAIQLSTNYLTDLKYTRLLNSPCAGSSMDWQIRRGK